VTVGGKKLGSRIEIELESRLLACVSGRRKACVLANVERRVEHGRKSKLLDSCLPLRAVRNARITEEDVKL
jgi:hypothetical protein